MEYLGWQALLNFIAVYLIRFAETSNWSFLKKIDEEYVWLRRGIILAFSTATAAGLVFHYEVSSGDFVLSGNFWTLLHGFKHIGTNYLGIQGMYWVKLVYDSIVELKNPLKTALENLNTPATPPSPVPAALPAVPPARKP